jgi:hypothetical protein
MIYQNNIEVMSDTTVFHKIGNSMLEIIQSVRMFHGEYFLGGLFLGLTKPSMGWALLGLFTAMPTIVVLKHPEWLHRFKDEKIEHMLLLILLMMSSHIYVFQCFMNALGIHWP